MNEPFQSSLNAVQKWVEERNYKGYDPGDGQTSFLAPLTFGNLFAERVLQQIIWKFPINLRPILGVKPLDSTKGRGFMAFGHMLLLQKFGREEDRIKGEACLDWLDKNHTTTYPGHSWGNHFKFSARGGSIPKGEPTIVWSSLIGQGFLEAFEQTQNERWLDVSKGICTWIQSIPREKTPTGTCLSYVGYEQSSIHNSSLLGAGMLARTWKHVKKDEYIDLAREAVLYSCSRQREDGSWWYGEHPSFHWIDNFHTAYNLDNIKRYIDATGDNTFKPHLMKGYQYFKEVFFEDTGRPRYYHNHTFPVDIQCASQAIDTFALFSELDPDALGLAQKVARWTIETMQDRTGYFYYRQYPMMIAKTPYFHWGQATMFKALAHLLLKMPSCGNRMNLLAHTEQPSERLST